MHRYPLWSALLALALGAWDAGAQLPDPGLAGLCDQEPNVSALCDQELDEAAGQGDVALESVRLVRRMLEGRLRAAQQDAESDTRVFVGGATGSTGVLAGVSHQLNGFEVGGALGYVAEEADLRTLGKLDSKTLNISVLGAWRAPRGNGDCFSYVSSVFIYGRQQMDVARTIAQTGHPPQTAQASPDGRQLSVSVEGGMGAPKGRFCLGGFGHVNWDEARIDRYTESGAPGQDLEVFEQRAESLLAEAGFELSFRAAAGNGTGLAFFLRIGYLHEFADDPRRITARFAGNPPSTFFVTTAPPDRDYVELELTAQFSSAANWTVFLGIHEELQHDGQYDTSGYQAGITYRF